VVQEWKTSGAGKDWVTYLAGPNGPAYRLEEHKDSQGVVTSSTLRWYAYDGLGCVLAEIDADGNTMSARVYDVYGGVRRTAGTATSRHGYVAARDYETYGNVHAGYVAAACGIDQTDMLRAAGLGSVVHNGKRYPGSPFGWPLGDGPAAPYKDDFAGQFQIRVGYAMYQRDHPPTEEDTILDDPIFRPDKRLLFMPL
jgi:hypothetical protein